MVCWSCKSLDVVCLIQKDGEDGYFYGKWVCGGLEIVNNLGCVDCYNIVFLEFVKGKLELIFFCLYAVCVMEVIGKFFEKVGCFDQ